MSEKNAGGKIYQIYVKGECIYHSLNEEEFVTIWTSLRRLADLLSDTSEISYKEFFTFESENHKA